MILLVSNERDVTTDFVVRELRTQGLSFVRLNTDQLLRCWRISWCLEGWSARGPLDRTINSSDVYAVYYRRPRAPHPVDGTAYEAGAFASREGATLLRWMLAQLNANWVSAPEAIFSAENKLLQLQLAHALGFVVPASLVTSDPMEARDFLASFEYAIVKPLSSGLLSDDPPQIAYTSLVSRDSNLEEVAVAPHFFQQYIEKCADIRVTVVDNDVFACRIHSQDRDDTRIDWRTSGASRSPLRHEMFQLPKNVEARCVALVKTLKLRFGAIDLVEHADGYTFLEINPNGQWAWIEQETGAKIAASIVHALSRNQVRTLASE